MSGDLLVRGGELIEPGRTLRRADVRIRGGAIAEVAPGLEPGAGEAVLDAGRAYVVPGLINAHMHSGENFSPGRYENLPLDLWFVHSHQVTRTAPPPADAIYARTMLGAMLMLRSGTTAAVDFLFEAPEISMETLEPVVRAYRDAGIRATILLGVADLRFADSLPLTAGERQAWRDEAPPPSLEGFMRLARDAVERWDQPDGLIRIGLGPSAPQRCSRELMEATLALARERDLPWQTHVLETRTQAWSARQWHDGRSFVDVMAAAGMLGEETSLVHTVWLTDRDIETLAATRTTAVHCLMSNLRLGDGLARVGDMRRAGIRIGLGTDGRGCDETLSMLELTRMAALAHKISGDHHTSWTTAEDSLSMATREGSICTGHHDRLGRLEPGAHGDLVLVDRGSVAFTPLNEPLRQLVLGAESRDVATVVVAGEVVARDGRLTRIDEAAVTELITEQAARELAFAPGRVADDLERLAEAVYRRAESAPLEVERYTRG